RRPPKRLVSGVCFSDLRLGLFARYLAGWLAGFAIKAKRFPELSKGEKALVKALPGKPGDETGEGQSKRVESQSQGLSNKTALTASQRAIGQTTSNYNRVTPINHNQGKGRGGNRASVEKRACLDYFTKARPGKVTLEVWDRSVYQKEIDRLGTW
ncbi:hypothetical protein BHE90_010189, partial [Fusarium euwallaceae]